MYEDPFGMNFGDNPQPNEDPFGVGHGDEDPFGINFQQNRNPSILQQTPPRPASQKTPQVQHKKSFWTQEEDAILSEAVKTCSVNGEVQNWQQVASLVPGRTYQQCYQRYLNYLKPGLKKDEWSQDEINIIKSRMEIFANSISKYKPYLPGRSYDQIKNKINALMKERGRKMNARPRMSAGSMMPSISPNFSQPQNFAAHSLSPNSQLEFAASSLSPQFSGSESWSALSADQEFNFQEFQDFETFE